ncbi:MAG: permease [Desulfobacteraceae bacterium]|nr:permease [Desulfobacteraceae bacterium]MCF8095376.1 permease [Desulfobacteraceae bacterium]
MIIALILLVLIAVFTSVYAYKRGDNSHVKGLTIAKNTFINISPLLVMAFIMAGFMQVVIPPELIQSWLGEEAGLKGVLIGSIGGALIPGGPYISFPIIASIFKSGAGLGTVVAFVTGWSMWGVLTIAFELALIGYRFTLLRLALVSIFPPLAGIMTYILF